MVERREEGIRFPCLHRKLGQPVPEEIFFGVGVGRLVALFRDLVEIFAGRNGRGEWVAVNDFDGGVTRKGAICVIVRI